MEILVMVVLVMVVLEMVVLEMVVLVMVVFKTVVLVMNIINFSHVNSLQLKERNALRRNLEISEKNLNEITYDIIYNYTRNRFVCMTYTCLVQYIHLTPINSSNKCMFLYQFIFCF